jgi:hypothetical protein
VTEDRLHRASRWKAFYDEEDGLGEAIAMLRRSYFERAAELTVKDGEQLMKLALADKILAEIDAYVRNVGHIGAIEAARRHMARIEELPPAKRRWI